MVKTRTSAASERKEPKRALRKAASRSAAPKIGKTIGNKTPSGSTAASRPPIHADILAYNAAQSADDTHICDVLAKTIHATLMKRIASGLEHKIWHRHPVWFIEGNPIVGYHKLKDCVRLLFWSGQSFDEPGLAPEGSFKAAEARYTSAKRISKKDLNRWLLKSISIQWDYKNIVKRKGKLERLK